MNRQPHLASNEIYIDTTANRPSTLLPPSAISRPTALNHLGSYLTPLASSATPLGSWLRTLMERVHRNVAVVALANKLARIAWVVLRRGTVFNANPAAVTA